MAAWLEFFGLDAVEVADGFRCDKCAGQKDKADGTDEDRERHGQLSRRSCDQRNKSRHHAADGKANVPGQAGPGGANRRWEALVQIDQDWRVTRTSKGTQDDRVDPDHEDAVRSREQQKNRRHRNQPNDTEPDKGSLATDERAEMACRHRGDQHRDTRDHQDHCRLTVRNVIHDFQEGRQVARRQVVTAAPADGQEQVDQQDRADDRGDRQKR